MATTFRADEDFNLKRVREFRITLNGIVDNSVYTMRALVAKNTGKAYYSKNNAPMSPGEGFAGDENKLFEYQPVGIARDENSAIRQRVGGPAGMKEAMNQTRVPVVQVYNYVQGENLHEVQRSTKVLGIAEGTGRDSGDPGCSVIVGGIAPFSNTTPAIIPTGALLAAGPWPNDDLDSLKPAKRHAADAHGRVPIVCQEFKPKSLRVNQHVRDSLARILCLVDDGTLRFIEDLDAKDQTAKNFPDYLRMRRRQLQADRSFDAAVRQLIMSLAVLATPANTRLEKKTIGKNLTEVITAVWMSGVPLGNSTVPANAVKLSGIREILTMMPFHKVLGSSGMSRKDAMDKIAAVCEDQLKNKPMLTESDPLNAVVHGFMLLKQDAEESVIGTVTLGPGPRKTGEVHLHKYAN